MNSANDLETLLAREFPVERELLYLNHAAVAPLPVRAAKALEDFSKDYVINGSRHYDRWLAQECTLRDQLRELINAPSVDDIALVKNTSEGLSFVAYGFPWTPGDNVVISNEEFPSNRIVWESLADQGVKVREVDLAGSAPEAALIAASDQNTRVISISSVQYASGIRLDLEAIGSHCRERDIAFCVDAIQGLGAIRQDVQAMHIDFMVADAHKWMLGPEGIALFYCRPTWCKRLKLHEFGWHMTEHPADFERRDWRPAGSARRFECGSPNMLGIYAFSASLSLLLEIGMDEIERRVLARAEHLFEAIGRRKQLVCLTPTTPGRYAGIVTFRPTAVSAEKLFRHLDAHTVMCAQRGGGIRFSPHCYNRFETLDRTMERVDTCQ